MGSPESKHGHHPSNLPDGPMEHPGCVGEAGGDGEGVLCQLHPHRQPNPCPPGWRTPPLFASPLLGFPILDKLLGGGGGGASYGSNLEVSDGYGAPSSSYGAPEPSYGAPEPSYGAPAASNSYDAPASNSYDAPASNSYDAPISNSYDTPSSGYDAGRRKRSLEFPSEARELYSDLNLAVQPFDASGPHLSVDHAFVPAATPLGATLPLLN